MSFTGNEDHAFTLAEAAEWTANYRATVATTAIKGHYFGRAIIENILAQTDCVGIRIYYALNDDGEQRLIISGVKADENDIFNGVIAEKSFLCPNRCGVANPLNSDVT